MLVEAAAKERGRSASWMPATLAWNELGNVDETGFLSSAFLEEIRTWQGWNR